MMTAKSTRSVVVVYDSPATREAAVSFCDQLVQRFWHELELDVSWWAADKLRDLNAAEHSSKRAVGADLIIFALPSRREVPIDIQAWVDTWVHERGDREGAVVGLITDAQGPGLEAGEAEMFLRHVARRAGMDYLTQVPPSVASQIPESIESCVARAQQVTSVLDEILHQQPPPPRLL